MITFTETELEDGRWGIVAVPQDRADSDVLNDNSPQGALAYLDLVLTHALECAEDAQQPRIRARILEAIGELDLAKYSARTMLKVSKEQERQDALPMAMPVTLPKLRLMDGQGPT